MLKLKSIESDLKPYGFIKLDYGRTWVNGSLAFIGETFVILEKPSSKDFETIAKMHEDKIIMVGCLK